MSKDFRIKDKSSKDGIVYVPKEFLLQQENEEDWNDQLLHDFAEESDVGDTWETHNLEIECILNEEDKEDVAKIPLSVIETAIDALYLNFSPYLDEEDETKIPFSVIETVIDTIWFNFSPYLDEEAQS